MVIFTTAYDQHAVRAFETHALDYLLKPFRPERFGTAVARAATRFSDRRANAATEGLLKLIAARQGESGSAPKAPVLTRLTARTQDRVVVIKTTAVDFIHSAGNYVAVHVGGESHLVRETLNALETQLDPVTFLRISRSVIVNLDRVKELHPMFKGDHLVVLLSGKRLAMTRGLREVERALKFS